MRLPLIPAALTYHLSSPRRQIDRAEFVVTAVEDTVDEVTFGQVGVPGGCRYLDEVESADLVVRGGMAGPLG